MSYVATLQKTWIDGSASLVPTWVDTSTPMVASADDFDSAIGTASVANATTTTPDVTLTPYNPGEVSGWLMIYTRYTGCSGKTPEFTLSFSSYRSSQSVDSWEMVWRYVDDSDPGTGRPRPWQTFDNGSGSPTHVFSNNVAFTQDEIEVAVKPRWRYLDTQHTVAYAALSSYASELPSATAFGGTEHVFNTTTLTSGADNSAAPTTLNQYGLLLDDTSSQPAGGEDKLNIVMLMTQHSSEDQGSYAGWEMMLFYLEGVGTVADWFRQHCRLYFYDPNPAGRYYGAERWTQEQASDEDPNRQWGGTNSEQVSAVASAVAADIERVDVLMDWHGGFFLNGAGYSAEFGIYQDDAVDGAWRSRVNTLLSPQSFTDLGSVPGGSAQSYFTGLDSTQLSLTMELPVAVAGYPLQSSMYGGMVSASVEAVKEMVDNSELTLTSTTITGSGVVQNLGQQFATQVASRLGGWIQ